MRDNPLRMRDNPQDIQENISDCKGLKGVYVGTDPVPLKIIYLFFKANHF